MSQSNNNNNNQLKLNVNDLTLEPTRLSRCKTIHGPLILARDSDLYILRAGTKKVIKSWITDNVVANRRLNEATGYIEKIDPTIEEADRRLLIPNVILEEEHTRQWLKLHQETKEKTR